ncbi:HIRAN domain-containing protein [Enterovirga rhinocerotis]|uniref:HIRAN domain-containing protein n=1 Tax=Enterovirga rhinocerotis TaxID=1339210 RepID=A0A4R7CBP2_9HYPH|nr:HIRAN domain-containing protein [Enterovirga rhinocerotis]TDR94187.1 HIRAN domain-containing protein [Enterovirga rhinocerotis]
MKTATYPSGIVGLPFPSETGRPCRDVVLELLSPGDVVTLRRDPENTHDPDAIAVYAYDGREHRHCGFVPARHTGWIGEQLDAGRGLEATVGDFLYEGRTLKGVDLEITLDRAPAVAGSRRTMPG